MKQKKAMTKMWKAHMDVDDPNSEMSKIIDKIYSDHKEEVEQLKKRISDLEWKTDMTTWGA